MTAMQTKSPLRCSSCDKSQFDVHKLILFAHKHAANINVFICDECVEICVAIIEGPHLMTAADLYGEPPP